MSDQFISTGGGNTTRGSAFTYKNLAINFAVISLLFCVNKLGALGNLLSMFILALVAMQSTSGALKALSMLGLIIMGNPYIVEKSMVMTYFRFPLVILAGGRILFDLFTKRPEVMRLSFLNGLLLFGAVCVFIAPINGYFTSIAVLKASLFTYGVYCILAGTMVNRNGFSDLTLWFLALVAFISIATYFTIPLGLSHVFRGKIVSFGTGGLSGVTSHQQVLGSFASISAILCFSLGTFSRLPHRWMYNCLFLSFLPILWMTKSRTAVGTLLLAIIFVLAVAPFVVRGQKAMFKRFKPAKWIAAGTGLIIVGFFADFASGGNINEKMMGFVFKRGMGSHYTVTSEEITSSRMGLIEVSWDAFLNHPMTGINFGTSTDPRFAYTATILSAPTEKGFLPTAILEETGIIGTAFFLLFLLLFFYRLYCDENIIGIAVMAGFLFQNLGEMMFFSLGGAGLFCWSIIGAGVAIGYRHQTMRRP
tara:strand:- start:2306 stop:3736 length:1431 start_codon:yes stop_codon:yes gene_type:complete